jgi:hypothetical protein
MRTKDVQISLRFTGPFQANRVGKENCKVQSSFSKTGQRFRAKTILETIIQNLQNVFGRQSI